MKPAFSVIFLTTLIGAAQGLLLALFTTELLGLWGLLPASAQADFYIIGALLAVVLAVLGLGSSFLHLGRPERAWRSAAMWRTSWLSREVIALPAFMAATFLYGLAHYGATNPTLLPQGVLLDESVLLVLGGVAGVLALALFVCTAMIYACLPFLREWHSPLTVINYTVLGSASGFLLAASLAGYYAAELIPFLCASALGLTLSGWLFRGWSLWRNQRLRPKSTIQTAIGIKHPQIVQKSAGFLGGSFNTREFFHGQSATLLRAVKWGFVILSFVVPTVLMITSLRTQTYWLLPLSFGVQYVGLLMERWYFFAQANHPQNHYYQAIR